MKYIVTYGFSDRSGILYEAESGVSKYCTESAIVKLAKDNYIIGAFVDTKHNRVDKLQPYDFIKFENLNNAYEYCYEHSIDIGEVEFINDDYYVFFKKSIYGIEYVIVSYRGEPNMIDYATYVGHKGYTNYLNSAMTFDRDTAYKRVTRMNDKGTRKWEVIALVITYGRVMRLKDMLRKC